jgi:hypothetical protein
MNETEPNTKRVASATETIYYAGEERCNRAYKILRTVEGKDKKILYTHGSTTVRGD